MATDAELQCPRCVFRLQKWKLHSGATREARDNKHFPSNKRRVIEANLKYGMREIVKIDYS